MKVLFIGGTGTISSAISELAVRNGIELYLLNRGNRSQFVPEGVKMISADIRDEKEVVEKLKGAKFDIVADFIAFQTADVERDFRLFRDKTRQYIFISSASAYQKPLANPLIIESTPLSNPYWEYSRNKIACEEYLMEKYRTKNFPVTIIRPSHTYNKNSMPLDIRGPKGAFSVLERIRKGKKVLLHGDGTSLWTVTHARDFAKAFIGIMGNIHAIGEAYHITSDEKLTWNQIYETIAAEMGVKPNLVHIATDTLTALSDTFVGGIQGDKMSSVIFDNTKIKRAVPDFEATIRFDQGVRESLDYIYTHKELQIEDPEFDAWTDALIESYENAVSSFPKLRG